MGLVGFEVSPSCWLLQLVFDGNPWRLLTRLPQAAMLCECIEYRRGAARARGGWQSVGCGGLCSKKK